MSNRCAFIAAMAIALLSMLAPSTGAAAEPAPVWLVQAPEGRRQGDPWPHGAAPREYRLLNLLVELLRKRVLDDGGGARLTESPVANVSRTLRLSISPDKVHLALRYRF